MLTKLNRDYTLAAMDSAIGNQTEEEKKKYDDDHGVIIIMRGLPGSGKSHEVKDIIEDFFSEANAPIVCSADHFFTNINVKTQKSEYNFKPWLLSQAHESCKMTAMQAILNGYDVIIDNTSSCHWEYELYILMAESRDYHVVVVDLFDSGLTDEELFKRGTHGVPLEGITRMRERWEH